MNERKQVKTWQRTSVQYLYKHAKSGTYYARIRVGKGEKWKSLRTTSLSVARLRLADFLKTAMQVRQSNKAVESGQFTMGDLIRIYRQRVEENLDFAEATKRARLSALKRVLKSWPGFEKLEPRQVTAAALFEWSDRLKKDGTGFAPPGAKGPTSKTKGNSATSVNQAVDTVKRLLNLAVERGAIYVNPALIKAPEGRGRLRAKVVQKRVKLPERDSFNAVIAEMESSGSGWAPHAADLARFLAFSGCRLREAGRVTWADVDLRAKRLHVRGTKSESSDRYVPIIKPLQDLLEELRQDAGEDVKPSQRVLRVRECQKSIDRACEKLGIERFSHHDLRHLFATVCIESGVDIPTVSRWLGHKDGGALAMRTYGHLRDEHSQRQAELVTF